MDRHVLSLDRQFHGQRADFNHFADIQTDRKRDHIAALVCVPVDEHVRRGTDPPSTARKILEEILDVHLANGLRAGTTNREPLLRKYSRQPLITYVAKYSRGADLPFVLSEP